MICRTKSSESARISKALTSCFFAARNPKSKASYSAILFVHSPKNFLCFETISPAEVRNAAPAPP
ncbi:MAG: hypothetical protein A3B70_03035 [Deltaproteobacteria bacterium RIFCSPHIGHO2_02_FULL_40_11]|nr:MAG: hypothetical protein A3B70_03035 [Deltaproteobacteria bacterium RIFCSPHIGHO2_02_FULL_40_11]